MVVVEDRIEFKDTRQPVDMFDPGSWLKHLILTRDWCVSPNVMKTIKSTLLLAVAANMHKLFYFLPLLLFSFFLLFYMMKCVGCKKEFNKLGFPSHKKACNLLKCAMREWLNNIPDCASGAGPSTTNKEMVTGSAGLPVDPVEMLLDDEQVRFYSQNFIQKLNLKKLWFSGARTQKRPDPTHDPTHGIPKIWATPSQNQAPKTISRCTSPTATSDHSSCHWNTSTITACRGTSSHAQIWNPPK